MQSCSCVLSCVYICLHLCIIRILFWALSTRQPFVKIIRLTLVYCGSLPSVHACLHRAPRYCICSFSGSSLQAPSCERDSLLTVLAGAITSLSIGVVGNCLIGLLIGFALQPAPMLSYSVLVIPARENTPLPEPVVAGRVSAESQAPFKRSGQWLPVKALLSSSTLL